MRVPFLHARIEKSVLTRVAFCFDQRVAAPLNLVSAPEGNGINTLSIRKYLKTSESPKGDWYAFGKATNCINLESVDSSSRNRF